MRAIISDQIAMERHPCSTGSVIGSDTPEAKLRPFVRETTGNRIEEKLAPLFGNLGPATGPDNDAFMPFISSKPFQEDVSNAAVSAFDQLLLSRGQMRSSGVSSISHTVPYQVNAGRQ